jgi:hypothetical protein
LAAGEESVVFQVGKKGPEVAFAALQALQFFDDAKRPVPVEHRRFVAGERFDPLPQILQIGRIERIPTTGTVAIVRCDRFVSG